VLTGPVRASHGVLGARLRPLGGLHLDRGGGRFFLELPAEDADHVFGVGAGLFLPLEFALLRLDEGRGFHGSLLVSPVARDVLLEDGPENFDSPVLFVNLLDEGVDFFSE